jgi:hypothetical protein
MRIIRISYPERISMKQVNANLSIAELLARQDWLCQQADMLVETLGLLEIASTAGSPQIVGSYDLGLMVWPDLDIEIHTGVMPEMTQALRVVSGLMLDAGVTKLNISDTRRKIKPEIPRGIYIGPDIRFGELKWQVDIWLIDAETVSRRERLSEGFRAKLNDANRCSILQIKQVAAASDRYHRGVSSVDIYHAVLEQGVTDIEGFGRYLGETGRSL